MAEPAVLYVVATPIGNLEDITLRAIRVLKETPHVFSEGTESSYHLLQKLGIKKNIECYTESRREAGARRVLELLAQGESVALISEAGTPAVSDPGADLVDRVRGAGFRVVPIPGPSAITALLSVAGRGVDRFWFEGYLPRKRGERQRLLRALAGVDRPVLCFEAPHRLEEALEDLVECLGAERLAFIGRELTKVHEEIRRGTLAEHLAWVKENPPRGECTLVIHPASQAAVTAPAPEEAVLIERLAALMRDQKLPRGKAAAQLARETGLPRKQIYNLGFTPPAEDEEVEEEVDEEVEEGGEEGLEDEVLDGEAEDADDPDTDAADADDSDATGADDAGAPVP